jgi:cerevisin
LISIATRGALTDVPSDTENVLAWNGGGNSNVTDIISKGGYKVLNTYGEVDDLINEAEKFVKEELGAIYSEIMDAVA